MAPLLAASPYALTEGAWRNEWKFLVLVVVVGYVEGDGMKSEGATSGAETFTVRGCNDGDLTGDLSKNGVWVGLDGDDISPRSDETDASARPGGSEGVSNGDTGGSRELRLSTSTGSGESVGVGGRKPSPPMSKSTAW